MPDHALGEFYPDWLIKQAMNFVGQHWTLGMIHAYCAPRMRFMKYVDRGAEWLKQHYVIGEVNA
jgi:hypothetical protein